MKIKKGDHVIVLAGKDKGATGYKINEDGTKVRVLRPSGKEI
jgi:ribosomal protein L24